MSFEILSNAGEPRLLRAMDSIADTVLLGDHSDFVDCDGHRYVAFFDGSNVIFNDGSGDRVGRWLLGSVATVIQKTRRLPGGFCFTFMDHGCGPQRLHALWTLHGSVQEAIASWKMAGFSVSIPDRTWNRNHPASIHLRTRGARCTGADSSHVTIPAIQTGSNTTGTIHVGEFNPLTGFGVGFLLHHLEGWMGNRRVRHTLIE